jgi:hypothetical protein
LVLRSVLIVFVRFRAPLQGIVDATVELLPY